MAPRKGKKVRRGDDDSDGDEGRESRPSEQTDGMARPTAAPKKEKKKKVSKKKARAGDWSSEEDAAEQPSAAVDEENAEEEEAAHRSGPSNSKAVFALLQAEQEEEEDMGGAALEAAGSLSGGEAEEDDRVQLVVAEVVSVSAHPQADRLKVCSINSGQGTCKGVGCTTPGSGILVKQASLRGVEGFGMLCSAYDAGWLDKPDEQLLILPESAEPGQPVPAEPMEGAIYGMTAAAAGKERKSARGKKDVAAAFAALGLENGADADAQEADLARPLPKSKRRSKKDVGFAALGDEGGEVEEEEALPPKAKRKFKKDIGFAVPEEDGEAEEAPLPPLPAKQKSETGVGLAALDDDVLDEPPSSSPADNDEQPEVSIRAKRKPRKKVGFDASSAFAALGIDDEESEEAIAHNGSENGDVGSTANEPSAAGKKRTKTRAGPNADSSSEALEAGGREGPATLAADADAGFGKKKKKKARDIDLDAIMANINGPSTPEPQPEVLSEPAASSSEKALEDPQGGAAKPGEDDIDALLAQLEAPAVKPEAKGKKKKGKKGKAKAEDEEDLDAILAELGEAPVPASEAVPDAAAAGPGPTEAATDEALEMEAAAPGAAIATMDEDEALESGPAAEEEEAAEGKELTAAQKKKLKKKQKEKAKKSGGKEEEEEGEEAPAAAGGGKKGGKKPSAAVRRIQEEMAARKAAEEEATRLEAERVAREEEEARRAAEEEARKLEERARKKAAAAERRKERIKAGELLTGKAKKEAERLAAMRNQILKNAEAPIGEAEAEPDKKRKVIYAAKKKQAPKKTGEEATPSELQSSATEEAVALEDAAAQAEESAEAQEAAPPVEEAQIEEEEEEESDDMAWDEMDLDAVRLPGQEEAVEAKPKANGVAGHKPELEQAAMAQAAGEESAEEEGSSSEEDEDGSGEDDSDEESDGESSSYEMDSEDEREELLRAAKEKREARLAAAKQAGSTQNLRSPICCILGHVDTGKTKLLDNVRRTSVQEGEAGGITQQIGATYVPSDALRKRTAPLRKERDFELRLPGLLIIDTPGHESFTNLRTRGSSLCDIAILVVDLMHGLEPQTLESIQLLKQRKTPFIVALNKIDRLFEWKANADTPARETLESQATHVQREFDERLRAAKLMLNEQGLNVALYWENPDLRKFVNIVPTSAISGEGIPDMLQLLVQLTQKMMAERLMFISELQCTVLEVKVVEGLGTTIDVVLVNGVLREGEQIVLCGLGGPIVTTIRSLLTPHPLKELRVRGSYLHHKEIRAAQGIKIAAQNLENAVAGTQMLVVTPDDDIEALKAEVMEDMADIFSSVDRSGEGVCVQASTLGSLEALLAFLKSPAVKIPVSGINIGPIHKRDVMRANVMLEKGRKKFAVILAFDVPVTKEAREVAEDLGVRIFTADIIYHLFDQFTAYLKQAKEEEQEGAKGEAVFPVVLRILPGCVFNKKDPILLGCEIDEGVAKVGTPLCVPSQGSFRLGRIASMELNHKAVNTAKKGDSIALKIEATSPDEATRLYGRHFTDKDLLVSRISRRSIDLLKQHFADSMTKEDWILVIKLKKMFGIQ